MKGPPDLKLEGMVRMAEALPGRFSIPDMFQKVSAGLKKGLFALSTGFSLVISKKASSESQVTLNFLLIYERSIF